MRGLDATLLPLLSHTTLTPPRENAPLMEPGVWAGAHTSLQVARRRSSLSLLHPAQEAPRSDGFAVQQRAEEEGEHQGLPEPHAKGKISPLTPRRLLTRS